MPEITVNIVARFNEETKNIEIVAVGGDETTVLGTIEPEVYQGWPLAAVEEPEPTPDPEPEVEEEPEPTPDPEPEVEEEPEAEEPTDEEEVEEVEADETSE